METKKGVFYGVGVGPGDPELMTLKAVRVLQSCQVIAAPQTQSGAMLAFDIAKQVVDLDSKTIVPLLFTMDRDEVKQHKAHMTAAEAVEKHLAVGRDVAMLNLGDVSIYSTYCYMMDILRNKGYETMMISGVPSFCAVAARLGIGLTEMNTPLHIIPAGGMPTDDILELSGTKILMKAGRHMEQLIHALSNKNILDKAITVENCGLQNEMIFKDMSEISEKIGYFATVIVKE